MGGRSRRVALAAAFVSGLAARAEAQTPAPAIDGAAVALQHEHQMPMNEARTWTFGQDGVVFLMVNHQGGPRGGDEFMVPNWWMGTASRNVGASRLEFNAMVSLDPATVGTLGYRELFQIGEAVDGKPLVDRQHPHDFFMQLAGIWRVPMGGAAALTVAGGPVGEPALGPVAFMHRAAAAENPIAPLAHHTLDSTHIAFGVVTASVESGRWTIEGSVFNGREPDERRWDFDFGPLDSVSARLWFRPTPEWELQVSTGHLTDPEQLEPGDLQRTTASASWFRTSERGFTAVTAAYGANAGHGSIRQAVLAEVTKRRDANAVFGRFEIRQSDSPALTATVTAFTAGAVHDVLRWRGFEAGVGAAATVDLTPRDLQAAYGDHPVSFQVFVRVRPPAPMGRMWNMRMSRLMDDHHH
jgi:hypothetical protein